MVCRFRFPTGAMKATSPARQQTWKDHCIDAVLLTMVVGSIVGLAVVYIRR